MNQYYYPEENKKQEGTWLIWPHHHTYGKKFQKSIENIWVQMAYSLHHGENIHMIAYDDMEKNRILKLLMENDFNLSNIDFVIAKSDDVWARDTGPLFVLDEQSNLHIVNFNFDGWGKKAPYKNDKKIPELIASNKKIPMIHVPELVLEGGSVEVDGSGSAMLTKSSVISKNRNSHLTIKQVEKYLSQYLGITNFIWLEGVVDEDITDGHIDGLARFYDENTIVSVSRDDFLDLYETILESDYERLVNAKNAEGKSYHIIELPLTSKNVKGLNYKGNYLNYYIGNEVVLVPIYNDPFDKVALDILGKLYKDRQMVPIDVTALYPYGGMLHCVTQQQPNIEKETAF